jgi:ATP-dependent RNA helicase SUPV3L1/SUV3
MLQRHLGDLQRIGKASADPASSPAVRAITAMLADAGGVLPRKALAAPIGQLSKEDRAALYRLRIRLGALDVFVPALLKPEAQRWRAALLSVRTGSPMPELPSPGAATLPPTTDARAAELAYRRLGSGWLRIDLADRLAAHAHQVRAAGGQEVVDRQLVTSLGLDEAAVARLMGEVGFQPKGENWSWRGQRRRTERPAPATPGNAFANALAGLKR